MSSNKGQLATASASNNIHPAQPAAQAGVGWKPLWVLLSGLAALLILTFLSLTQGLADISVRTVVQAIFSPQDIADHHMIRGMRLPRTVMGLLAGAALAVAGALMQTVTRNPLASETTLGVNAGAYLAVVMGMVFWPSLLSQLSMPLAVLGGVIAAAAVFALGGGRKGTPIRIALAGMIITLVLSSITSALILLNEELVKGIFLWGSGSLVQNDWDGVAFTWPWVVGGLMAVCLAVRHLDVLTLNEETARSLGQKVMGTRIFAMGIAILIACVCVSVVGPIGFIGLMAPHIVRMSGLTRHAWLIPVSALWGAAILVGSDTIARLFIDLYGELPAGAVTSAIGAPWLIWLALRLSKQLKGSGSSAGQAMSMGGLQRRIPYPLLVILLFMSLILIWVVSLTSGTLPIPLSEVIAVLSGHGDELYRQILIDFRLPRLLVAGLAGMALAASGTLLQSAVRNPLGDPQVIGVTSGAGVGALLLMVILPQVSIQWLPLGAIIGGVAASAIVYSVSWRRGLNPTILTLVGIAVAAAGASVINILVIQAGLKVAPALAWLAGSTYGRGWSEVWQLIPTVCLLIPLGWWLGRRVDLLAFNDESATGLGLKVRRVRLYVAIVAVLLASMAAANVGAVGFIGLLAPHAARMLVGTNHRRSLIVSVLLGGVLLAAADWLGRIVIMPRDLPSGIVTALLGTPYLVYLMYKTGRSRG